MELTLPEDEQSNSSSQAGGFELGDEMGCVGVVKGIRDSSYKK